jgi:hypothetical protein
MCHAVRKTLPEPVAPTPEGARWKTSRARGIRALILNSMFRFAATLTLAAASALAAAQAQAKAQMAKAQTQPGGKRR